MDVRHLQRKIIKYIDATKKSLFSLLFDLGGLIAGFIFSSQLSFNNLFLWSVILYPGILSIRGAIGGSFSGNLTTSLHEGSIKPSFRKNTRKFKILLENIAISTFIGSILISFFSCISASVFVLNIFNELSNMLFVAMASMGLSILTISPFTILTAFISYRKGLDPDTIVYPITSTIADIILTSVYVSTIQLYIYSKMTIYLIDILFFISIILIFLHEKNDKNLIRSIKENFIMLLAVSAIINIAGSSLGKIVSKFNIKSIYIQYPALIDTVGDIGSIVGSVATTMLILGYTKPNISVFINNLETIAGAWSASLIMFSSYLFISYIVSPFNNPLSVLSVTFLTNIIAVPTIVIISNLIAILTYRKGFNPDNFVIPIEASLSDSITSLALYFSLKTLGF
ncbi:MAG: magnesium transporter [Thermoproteales archaeon]|nr:magnesium transporter [Thermoproteales archaeon]